MKRWQLFLISFPIILVTVAGLTVAGLYLFYPRVDAPEARSFAHDDAARARGAYLVEAVAACAACHSQRDWDRFGAPPLAGSEYVEGERFDASRGMQGVFVAPNLTPAHLGEWSDLEIAHALTTGVRPDGEPLLPLMPYLSYAGLCREDVDAIVAFLRTLAPRTSEVDASTLRRVEFPLNLILRTLPQGGDAPPCVGDTDPAALRGGYIARAAGCGNCHTPTREGRPVLDRAFAGGSEFLLPRGMVRAANITPDESTGIGSMDADGFVELFELRGAADRLEPGALNTNMPWWAYARMSERDLRDLHAFLQTVPAVANKVRTRSHAPDGTPIDAEPSPP